MNLVQPRTHIGLIVLIVGVLLTGLFGWFYGFALAGVGFAVVVHSILHGNNPGKLMISVLFCGRWAHSGSRQGMILHRMTRPVWIPSPALPRSTGLHW